MEFFLYWIKFQSLQSVFTIIFYYVGIRGESHFDFRTHCVIMTQIRWPLTPCHMHHSQIFDKIDSFLKTVSNIFILRNLILEWGEMVIKEKAGILHQIYGFKGAVNSWRSRIHQNKSCYYSGPFQTSKVELFLRKLFSAISR